MCEDDTTIESSFDIEEFRAESLAQWSGAARAWGEHASMVDEEARSVTRAMLAAANIRPGMRVLELACGPAGVGRAVAERIAPEGEIVCSDFSQEMVAVARERTRDLPNVSCRVLDAERIDEPDASFDAVVCRYGVMLFGDPAAAAGEIARVLRPGGRTALAVWGATQENPWISAIIGAVAAELQTPPAAPGAPGIFRFSDPAELERLLAGAGLAGVVVERVEGLREVASIDEWWSSQLALAAPLTKLFAAIEPERAQRIEHAAKQAAAAYAGDGGGVAIPALTLVASGARAPA